MTPEKFVKYNLYGLIVITSQIPTYKDIFQHWIVVQDDGDHPQVPQSSSCPTENVFSL
jgi:hypothetical protein